MTPPAGSVVVLALAIGGTQIPAAAVPPAREAIGAQAFRAPASRVRIVPAELGKDVGLVGAWPLVALRLGER